MLRCPDLCMSVDGISYLYQQQPRLSANVGIVLPGPSGADVTAFVTIGVKCLPHYNEPYLRNAS